MGALLVLIGCRPEAPDPKQLPRVEVPFSGFTDGSNRRATPVPAPAVSAAPAVATPSEGVGDLPDPPAAHYLDFIEYELQFVRGDVRVLGERKVRYKQPVAAERRMGRFALELFVGDELLERVRFDFPLLGAGALGGDDSIEHGLTSRATVRVPLVERARRAQLLDRKTRKVVAVSWPPGSDVPPAASTSADPSSAPPLPAQAD